MNGTEGVGWGGVGCVGPIRSIPSFIMTPFLQLRLGIFE